MTPISTQLAPLINKRICDLNLTLDNSFIPDLTTRLFKELNRVSLNHFHPKIYIGDDWFCPENSMRISVPFYLLSPELKLLEKLKVGYVEGGTKTEAMKLLRHEAGHCFFHAYQLNKSIECRKIFGSFGKPYNPDKYSKNPDSKDYVINLKDNYAQSHPEEDFAETFAIFIQNNSNWRIAYRNWPKAKAKLEFMERLIVKYSHQKPFIKVGKPLSEAKYLKRSLSRHYAKRTQELTH